MKKPIPAADNALLPLTVTSILSRQPAQVKFSQLDTHTPLLVSWAIGTAAASSGPILLD